jgi:hypothetical protein
MGPTTYRYRLPETCFDACCGNEHTKRAYLEACTEIFNHDNIQCIDVCRGTPGGAIITTRSTNPNHQEIVSNKLFELEHILGHSVANAHYYDNGSSENIEAVDPTEFRKFESHYCKHETKYYHDFETIREAQDKCLKEDCFGVHVQDGAEEKGNICLCKGDRGKDIWLESIGEGKSYVFVKLP